MGDCYVDTFGGSASRASEPSYLGASSPYGRGWTDADGTKWLPEEVITTDRKDRAYGIGSNEYSRWHSSEMPDNSLLRMEEESADG